jgi:5-methylcytosine-specific restriction endonuclease McrA
VRREAALRARISSEDEHRTAQDQFLVLQPSLDQSWWKLWGGLDGVSGAIVDKTLNQIADQLPPLPDGTRGDSSWRKATALAELAISDDPPPAQITVFIDSQHAVESDGQAGITLEAGPRVGQQALQAILCDAVTELTVTDQNGRLMEYGRRTRSIPPALRRAILHRDGNRCAADGCDSRNRLQTHHLTPWSEGGATDPDNLITLCWYHHHIVIHQQGFSPYHHPKHGRIRFRRPGPRDPPR